MRKLLLAAGLAAPVDRVISPAMARDEAGKPRMSWRLFVDAQASLWRKLPA